MPNPSNVLLLTAILTGMPSLALITPPKADSDISLDHLEHVPSLPPWALSDIERNLHDVQYSANVPTETQLVDGLEAADDRYERPLITRKKLSKIAGSGHRVAGIERRGPPTDGLADPLRTTMYHSFTRSESFEPSAPTESAAQLDIDYVRHAALAEASEADLSWPKPTTGMSFCGSLEQTDLTIIAMLAFTLMAAGTLLVLRLLLRRAMLRRRKARGARPSVDAVGVGLLGHESVALNVDDAGGKGWKA